MRLPYTRFKRGFGPAWLKRSFLIENLTETNMFNLKNRRKSFIVSFILNSFIVSFILLIFYYPMIFKFQFWLKWFNICYSRGSLNEFDIIDFDSILKQMLQVILFFFLLTSLSLIDFLISLSMFLLHHLLIYKYTKLFFQKFV